MIDNPIKSLNEYSRFVAEVCNRSTVKSSTVTVWSVSRYTGVAEGEIFLSGEYRLRMREELDFDEGIITSYGYEGACLGDRGGEIGREKIIKTCISPGQT